jgi:dTDP-glucose 4,6-dehydratase
MGDRMKICITGVGGFIPTNMLEYYIKNTSDEIVGITKTTQASYGQRVVNNLVKQYEDRLKVYYTDITDYIRLKDALDAEKPDQIIHMAAEADVSRSFDFPIDFLRTNVIGTFHILEWLRRNRGTRMVHFSTDECFATPNHLSKEDERLDPQNLYSASKASAEAYIGAYNACFDTQVQIVRPVNNFGAYQGTNRLFAKTIIRCLDNEPFSLFKETRTHLRWWIYALDTCSAVKYIIENGEKKGVYHITSDTAYKVEEVVFKILDRFGKRDLFQGYSELRPKDDESYALDGSKLRDLGWKERYTFEEALDLTIQWYKENISWFGKR